MVNTVYGLITELMEDVIAPLPALRWVDEASCKVMEKSFKEYATDIRSAAEYFRNEVPDIKGKRVALLSRNCYEYAVDTLGAIMAGAVLVTLNQRKTWDELKYELDLIEPALVMNDGVDYGYRAELEAEYGSVLRPMDAYVGTKPGEIAPIDHNALMMIMFTSGTTGRSKGVMISERNIFTAMLNFVPSVALLQVKQRELAPVEYRNTVIAHFTFLPMFHMAAFVNLFVYPLAGMTQNLCCDMRNIYRDMALMHSDTMSAAPMLVETVYNEVRRGHRDRLNGLWNLSCSSAALDPEILQYLTHNGFYINQCYGMTETCGDGLLNVVQSGEHLGALGKPDDHCEYKLDETDEICIRGGNVMLGYYKDPEGTAEVIDAEGWLHTGDLAREDAEGYYYMVGRKKNLIILSSGENVSPEELEHLLAECTDIKECIVKEKDKKICAVVYCEADKQDAVRTFITETNRKLPLYKRMTAVEFSAEPLPRNAMGKLLRK